MVLLWLICQTPGSIGSMLGLVGPVSACCEWVTRQVGCAHIFLIVAAGTLPKQIRPIEYTVMLWDVKHPRKKMSYLLWRTQKPTFGIALGWRNEKKKIKKGKVLWVRSYLGPRTVLTLQNLLAINYNYPRFSKILFSYSFFALSREISVYIKCSWMSLGIIWSFILQLNLLSPVPLIRL